MALSNPTTKQRPAALGFSVGHPAITAGTLGARVVDGTGTVYILSNNHVLANSNAASPGDATLQPGTYDGGTAADQIGALAAFRAIVFSSTASNTMDAAIAAVNGSDIGFGTQRMTAMARPVPRSSAMPTATACSTTRTRFSVWPSRNTVERPS
jgi:hypothetical protein